MFTVVAHWSLNRLYVFFYDFDFVCSEFTNLGGAFRKEAPHWHCYVTYTTPNCGTVG